MKDLTARAALREDICKIQLCFNESLFKQATELFRVKWKAYPSFVDNFYRKWCIAKNGWYEGYSVGVPSHSNSIESTHKHMKVKQRKSRMPLKRFIFSQLENGIVTEWSLERNPIYFVGGQELQNPNAKIYQSMPDIATKDWTDAFKWNAKNHVFIKPFKNQDIFCTSDEKKAITKDECRQFIKDVSECKWNSFNEMMTEINHIRLINLSSEWKNSECSCGIWQKNLKCNHVIALACRLQLASFSTIAMNVPLQHKRRKGAPKKMAPALVHQAISFQEEEMRGIEVDSDEEEAVEEQVPVPVVIARKRGRPAKSGSQPAKKSKV